MSDVLIVEDEPEIAELIEFHLAREGFTSRTVHSGRLALEEVHEVGPALIILDLMLPDVEGFEICRRLKASPETRDIPVVMVTAKAEDTDIVAGIELGADDYIVKPFSPKVLVARVKNVLRRNEQPTTVDESLQNRIRLFDDRLVIDSDRHEVLVDGGKIQLTLTEFGLLKFLAARPGIARSRDQIISAVHGRDIILSSRTVDVHVTAVRRKLGDLGPCIETVRGVGYRFTDSAATSTA